MFNTNALNLVRVEPTAVPVNLQIYHEIDLLSRAYPDYLWAKFFAARRSVTRYPEYPIRIDEDHDKRSVLFFSCADKGNVNGTTRVCFDSDDGLLITEYVKDEYQSRRKYQTVAEVGRLHCDGDDCCSYKYFVACVYQLAVTMRIQCYLMQVRKEHRKMYEKLFGARVINETKSCPGCIHMAWEIDSTPPAFFRRFPVTAIETVFNNYKNRGH